MKIRFAKVVVGLLIAFSSCASFAAKQGCPLDKSQEAILAKLFGREEHLYSLLWWKDSKSNLINARSFIINGHDSVPVFTSEAEAKSQVAGSGYEKDIVGIKPSLLAGVLQNIEYAVLNPGSPTPLQFKTCLLKKYVSANGA